MSFLLSPASAAAPFSGYLSRFSPEQLCVLPPSLEPCSVQHCKGASLGEMGRAGRNGIRTAGELPQSRDRSRALLHQQGSTPASLGFTLPPGSGALFLLSEAIGSGWVCPFLVSGLAFLPGSVTMSGIIFGISLELDHPAAASESSFCFQSFRDADWGLVPLYFIAWTHTYIHTYTLKKNLIIFFPFYLFFQ